jgi:ankyrin repeat protein
MSCDCCKQTDLGYEKSYYTILKDFHNKDNNTISIANNNLLEACKRVDLEAIKLLLTQGADVNVTNVYGDTPLLLLSLSDSKTNMRKSDTNERVYSQKQLDRFEAIKHLLENGAKIDVENLFGYTPLFSICEQGETNILELFISQKCDIDYVNKNGYTALMFACKQLDIQILELLVNNGIDVNAVNKDGNTALLTLFRYDPDISRIEYLFSKGADIHVTSTSYCKAMELALSRKNDTRFVDILNRLNTLFPNFPTITIAFTGTNSINVFSTKPITIQEGEKFKQLYKEYCLNHDNFSNSY